MIRRRMGTVAALGCLMGASVSAAAVPKLPDADTRAWWAITGNLASDARQGRDTGSPAYAAAARWTAERFRKAGLKPAGDDGGFLQSVPMRQVDVDAASARVELVAPDGTRHRLAFLEDVDVNASEALPADLTAGLAFRGYCGADAMTGDLAGKVVVCFGNRRKGLPLGSERIAGARKAGAVGVMTVDDAGFSLEPPRWPAAYSRTVTLKDEKAAPSTAPEPVLLRLSDAAFAAVIAGSGQDAAALLRAGTTQKPLPSFDLPNRLALGFHTTSRDIASPNVLMLLVQTLQAIFRDARMREQAGLIKVEVTRLLEDVGRMKERLGDLQRHFGAAADDLEKLNVSADKVIRRGARIEGLELQEPEGGVEIVRPKLVERS